MLRRRALVAVIAVLALGAGACAQNATNGGSPRDLSAFQLVSQAASKTEAAKTAHMSMTMSVTAGTGKSLTMAGNGAMDISNQAAQLSFAMSGLGGAMRSLKFDMVVTGGALYMHLPASASASMPAGKTWIKIDLAALSQRAGMGFGGLSGGSMAAFDPAQTLAYLKGVSKSVTHVGSETVRGTQTERYHVVIDPKKAMKEVTGSARCGLGAAEKALGTMSIPADVWIDEQGRLRRLQMHFTMSPPGTTQSIGMTMQMDLFDFGTPVHVTAPPASQVYDATAGVESHLPTSCVGQSA